MTDKSNDVELVEVPYSKLSETALRGVIESFVLREGTDYGNEETSLEMKVSQVLGQLKRGEVCIIFEAKEETLDIRPKKRKS